MNKVKLAKKVVESGGNGECQIPLITDARQMNGMVLDALEEIDPQVKSYAKTHDYYRVFRINVPSDIELEVTVADMKVGQKLYKVMYGLYRVDSFLDQITCYTRQDLWEPVSE